MLNKNERMEQLKAHGINVGKYFTVDLDNGTKIHLIIDENGNPVRVDNKDHDPIVNQIIEDGYVKNTRLFRRFVMAQMFQMLSYKSYDGKYEGYNDYLKRRYSYKYTIDMMMEEVRVLSKLEERDFETFKEREHFFDRNTVATVLEDYADALERYVEKLPSHRCKGVPYKKVKGINIFEDDLNKKLYLPVKYDASRIRCAKNYKEVYAILCGFKRNMVKLPWDTKKSAAWIDAYKGAGVFYTLKNLVMFHDCGISTEPYGHTLKGVSAVKYLNAMLDEYKGEYYRMFALMKKVIKDNKFDFNKRMEEIYNK